MSIKDLFNNNKLKTFQGLDSPLSASKEAESHEMVLAKAYEKKEFVPPVDYSTASNFAKYGSAELYYESSFTRIQQQYPYDGTLHERQLFENSSSYLDKYIFENIYPRTNGHVIMGYRGMTGVIENGYLNITDPAEYIYIAGGPHTASAGMENKKLESTFDDSTLYDVANRRASNLEFTAVSGSTIEFWLKKTAFESGNPKEVIFDLHNQQAYSTTAGDPYGRFRLEMNPAGSQPFVLHWHSGSVSNNLAIHGSLTNSDVADGNWHHYAVSIASLDSTSMRVRFYRDGSMVSDLSDSSNVIANIEGVTGGLNATIGSLVANPVNGGNLIIGDGKLSGSLDEFRYWKRERTAREIGLNWFKQVGGGTDDYTYNTDLGVYYKFNEGIVGTSSIDSTVLDYSGRISNGSWVGYAAGARLTSSAIVLSGYAHKEFKDPIIYSSHPDVSSSLAIYKAKGKDQDIHNTSMFYHLLPSWLIEEDTESNKNIKKLSQIMGSYFDTLYAQIYYSNKYKAKVYTSGSQKPVPFTRHNLRDSGFVMPDIFVEANIVESILEKDDNELYQRDIQEVKNLIYQNIYNNLTYIYKSKGTDKSFRNFFRCFGVDHDLIKLNLYADDSTYLFRDNVQYDSKKSHTLNFYHRDNFDAVVTHKVAPATGRGYIAGSADATKSAFTIETEAIFPHKLKQQDVNYFRVNFATASLFGFHSVDPSATEETFASTDSDLKVYAVKTGSVDYENTPNNSPHVYFVLTGAYNVQVSSSVFPDTYNNNKWNFALRVKPSKYPLTSLVQGAYHANDGYTVELYGVNTVGRDVKNEFLITASVPQTDGATYFTSGKKIFVGAERTNWTGSIIQRSDVRISDTKVWLSYLDNNIVKEHSYDVDNYGVEHPYHSDAPHVVDSFHVPQIDTLALHWDYTTNLTSDSSGEMLVDDVSSGSVSQATRYGWLGAISKVKHPGHGQYFTESSADAINKQYIYTAKSRAPGIIYSTDMVKIVTDQTENFFQDDDLSDNFFSFEKSMQSVISDEMINMFSSIKDFNNLVGEPVYRYRKNYKKLEHLRRLFFEKVENEPDPEKFFEFYKWIDQSISVALEQLMPVSTRFSAGVANVVESHVLERNKYQNKFPLITEVQSTEGNIKSVAELLYSWPKGHAPEEAATRKNVKYLEIAKKGTSGNALLSAPTFADKGGTPWTVYGWFQIPETPLFLSILKASKGVAAGWTVVIKRDTTNEVQVVLHDADGSGAKTWTFDSSGKITDDWFHMAIHHDGPNVTDGSVIVYVNGVALPQVGTPQENANWDGTAQLWTTLRLTSHSSSGYTWGIDEFGIHEGAFNDTLAQELYNSGKYLDIQTFSDKGNVFAHYSPGDSTGTADTIVPAGIVHDQINSNNLTVQIGVNSDVFLRDTPDNSPILTPPTIPMSSNKSCLWQKERRERTPAQLEKIKSVKTKQNLSETPVLKDIAGNSYFGSTYAVRSLTKPYKFALKIDPTIHGGINYSQNKKRGMANSFIRPHGSKTSLGVPTNVLGLGLGVGHGVLSVGTCDDNYDELTIDGYNSADLNKDKWGTKAIHGHYSPPGTGFQDTLPEMSQFTDQETVKGGMVFPFNLLSGSIGSGYNKKIEDDYYSDAVLVNLHSDTTMVGNDVPMQGVFTETHVGGHQSRHVEINNPTLFTTALTVATTTTSTTIVVADTTGFPDRGYIQLNDEVIEYTSKTASEFILNHVSKRGMHSTTAAIHGVGTTVHRPLDAWYSRPEAFRIMVSEHQNNPVSETDGALGMVGPDYGEGYPHETRRWAVRYREEHAKRPVNIKNIKHSSRGRAGNYNKNYEFFSFFGRKENNFYFRSEYGGTKPFLTAQNITNLPSTNVQGTLFAQTASSTVRGNTFHSTTSGLFHPQLTELEVHFSPSGSCEIPDPKCTKSVIAARFSAPGGPEVMSPAFLDVYNQERSPYNALPFRNLAVRGIKVRNSGSGTTSPAGFFQKSPANFGGSGEIENRRMFDHLGKSDGTLSALATRHMGKFGIDSMYGTISPFDYEGYTGTPGTYDSTLQVPASASFNKQHRNSWYKLTYQGYKGLVVGTPYEAGKFVSGSFEMNGLTHQAVQAKGHFELLGRTIRTGQSMGSFEVKGANYAGSRATGHLILSGSTTQGIAASGSFDMSGSGLAAVQSKGHMIVTGAYQAPTPSAGRFTSLGCNSAAAKATGLFKMKGNHSAGTAASLKIKVPEVAEKDYDPCVEFDISYLLSEGDSVEFTGSFLDSNAQGSHMLRVCQTPGSILAYDGKPGISALTPIIPTTGAQVPRNFHLVADHSSTSPAPWPAGTERGSFHLAFAIYSSDLDGPNTSTQIVRSHSDKYVYSAIDSNGEESIEVFFTSSHEDPLKRRMLVARRWFHATTAPSAGRCYEMRFKTFDDAGPGDWIHYHLFWNERGASAEAEWQLYQGIGLPLDCVTPHDPKGFSTPTRFERIEYDSFGSFTAPASTGHDEFGMVHTGKYVAASHMSPSTDVWRGVSYECLGGKVHDTSGNYFQSFRIMFAANFITALGSSTNGRISFDLIGSGTKDQYEITIKGGNTSSDSSFTLVGNLYQASIGTAASTTNTVDKITQHIATLLNGIASWDCTQVGTLDGFDFQETTLGTSGHHLTMFRVEDALINAGATPTSTLNSDWTVLFDEVSIWQTKHGQATWNQSGGEANISLDRKANIVYHTDRRPYTPTWNTLSGSLQVSHYKIGDEGAGFSGNFDAFAETGATAIKLMNAKQQTVSLPYRGAMMATNTDLYATGERDFKKSIGAYIDTIKTPTDYFSDIKILLQAAASQPLECSFTEFSSFWHSKNASGSPVKVPLWAKLSNNPSVTEYATTCDLHSHNFATHWARVRFEPPANKLFNGNMIRSSWSIGGTAASAENGIANIRSYQVPDMIPVVPAAPLWGHGESIVLTGGGDKITTINKFGEDITDYLGNSMHFAYDTPDTVVAAYDNARKALSNYNASNTTTHQYLSAQNYGTEYRIDQLSVVGVDIENPLSKCADTTTPAAFAVEMWTSVQKWRTSPSSNYNDIELFSFRTGTAANSFFVLGEFEPHNNKFTFQIKDTTKAEKFTIECDGFVDSADEWNEAAHNSSVGNGASFTAAAGAWNTFTDYICNGVHHIVFYFSGTADKTDANTTKNSAKIWVDGRELRIDNTTAAINNSNMSSDIFKGTPFGSIKQMYFFGSPSQLAPTKVKFHSIAVYGGAGFSLTTNDVVELYNNHAWDFSKSNSQTGLPPATKKAIYCVHKWEGDYIANDASNASGLPSSFTILDAGFTNQSHKLGVSPSDYTHHHPDKNDTGQTHLNAALAGVGVHSAANIWEPADGLPLISNWHTQTELDTAMASAINAYAGYASSPDGTARVIDISDQNTGIAGNSFAAQPFHSLPEFQATDLHNDASEPDAWKWYNNSTSQYEPLYGWKTFSGGVDSGGVQDGDYMELNGWKYQIYNAPSAGSPSNGTTIIGVDGANVVTAMKSAINATVAGKDPEFDSANDYPSHADSTGGFTVIGVTASAAGPAGVAYTSGFGIHNGGSFATVAGVAGGVTGGGLTFGDEIEIDTKKFQFYANGGTAPSAPVIGIEQPSPCSNKDLWNALALKIKDNTMFSGIQWTNGGTSATFTFSMIIQTEYPSTTRSLKDHTVIKVTDNVSTKYYEFIDSGSSSTSGIAGVHTIQFPIISMNSAFTHESNKSTSSDDQSLEHIAKKVKEQLEANSYVKVDYELDPGQDAGKALVAADISSSNRIIFTLTATQQTTAYIDVVLDTSTPYSTTDNWALPFALQYSGTNRDPAYAAIQGAAGGNSIATFNITASANNFGATGNSKLSLSQPAASPTFTPQQNTADGRDAQGAQAGDFFYLPKATTITDVKKIYIANSVTDVQMPSAIPSVGDGGWISSDYLTQFQIFKPSQLNTYDTSLPQHTNDSWWKVVTASIKHFTDYDTCQINDLGNGTARIEFTSSNVGESLETLSSVTPTAGHGNSISGWSFTAGQTAGGGVQNGDQIAISGTVFQIYTATPPSSPIIGVDATAGQASVDIWNDMRAKIIANTDYDTVNLVASDNPNMKRICITASGDLGTDHNGDLTGQSGGQDNGFLPNPGQNSFASLVDTAGGERAYGAFPGDYLELDGKRFQFYLDPSVVPSSTDPTDGTHVPPIVGVICGPSSSTFANGDFWLNLTAAIDANTNFKKPQITSSWGYNPAYPTDKRFAESLMQITSSNLFNHAAMTFGPFPHSFVSFFGPAGGGATMSGVTEADGITIDGITFEFDENSSVVGSNIAVNYNFNQDTIFWNHLYSKLTDTSLSSLTNNWTINGPKFNGVTAGHARFEFTASSLGDNNNKISTFANAGPSFGTIVDTAGGNPDSGAVVGEWISIYDTSAQKVFEITYGNSPVQAGAVALDSQGFANDTDWWNHVESVIGNNGFSHMNIVQDSNGATPNYMRFELTSSTLYPDYGTHNGPILESAGATTFNNLSNIANGVTLSPGCIDDDRITIQGVNFEINSNNAATLAADVTIDSREVANGGVYASDELFWDAFKSKLEARTELQHYDIKHTPSKASVAGRTLFEFTGNVSCSSPTLAPASMLADSLTITPATPSNGSFFNIEQIDGGRDCTKEVLVESISHSSYSVGHDNLYINSPLPRSDFQYSWIWKTTTGSKSGMNDYRQPHHGYSPADGLVLSASSVTHGPATYIPAIDFATECNECLYCVCIDDLLIKGDLVQEIECGDTSFDPATILSFQHEANITHTDIDTGTVDPENGVGGVITYTIHFGDLTQTTVYVHVTIKDTTAPRFWVGGIYDSTVTDVDGDGDIIEDQIHLWNIWSAADMANPSGKGQYLTSSLASGGDETSTPPRFFCDSDITANQILESFKITADDTCDGALAPVVNASDLAAIVCANPPDGGASTAYNKHGDHQVRVTATDAAGNSTEMSVKVKIPLMPINTAIDGLSGSPTVSEPRDPSKTVWTWLSDHGYVLNWNHCGFSGTKTNPSSPPSTMYMDPSSNGANSNITVTWTVDRGCGLTQDHSMIIALQDTGGPTIWYAERLASLTYGAKSSGHYAPSHPKPSWNTGARAVASGVGYNYYSPNNNDDPFFVQSQGYCEDITDGSVTGHSDQAACTTANLNYRWRPAASFLGRTGDGTHIVGGTTDPNSNYNSVGWYDAATDPGAGLYKYRSNSNTHAILTIHDHNNPIEYKRSKYNTSRHKIGAFPYLKDAGSMGLIDGAEPAIDIARSLGQGGADNSRKSGTRFWGQYVIAAYDDDREQEIHFRNDIHYRVFHWNGKTAPDPTSAGYTNGDELNYYIDNSDDSTTGKYVQLTNGGTSFNVPLTPFQQDMMNDSASGAFTPTAGEITNGWSPEGWRWQNDSTGANTPGQTYLHDSSTHHGIPNSHPHPDPGNAARAQGNSVIASSQPPGQQGAVGWGQEIDGSNHGMGDIQQYKGYHRYSQTKADNGTTVNSPSANRMIMEWLADATTHAGTETTDASWRNDGGFYVVCRARDDSGNYTHIVYFWKEDLGKQAAPVEVDSGDDGGWVLVPGSDLPGGGAILQPSDDVEKPSGHQFGSESESGE